MQPCQSDHAGLEITEVLKTLAGRGITRLFCEGGGTLAASLLRAGLVDRLVGEDGVPGLAYLGIKTLPDAPRFCLHDVRRLGPDIIADWRARPDP